MYSYHIFYFPFKWELPEKRQMTFSEQVDLQSIRFNTLSSWKRVWIDSDEEQNDVYNEKNYYFPFVHPVLYDDNTPGSLIYHFERKEPKIGPVFYNISLKGGVTYRLRVDAINVNLYSTGVGTLSFYCRNERESQSGPNDILRINQYGRRIMPPFIGDVELRIETAASLEIEGLDAPAPDTYREDFNRYTNLDSWKPASFICTLMNDLVENIQITPAVDDRMFVACWYGNNELSAEIFGKYNGDKPEETKADLSEEEKEQKRLESFLYGDFWYRFIFVDAGDLTCQNWAMQKDLIDKQTYPRWQRYGTLHGCSRYSLVMLSNTSGYAKEVLLRYFVTIYSRMVELVLVQRASLLRFSSEVTQVSKLPSQEVGVVSERISSLYKEYIRFVNQVYFRNITAQDQGIELYEMLMGTLQMKQKIEDLDKEIEELHQYVSLMEDRERNIKATKLNDIAGILLPASIVTGLFGMNQLKDLTDNYTFYSLLFEIPLIAILTGWIWYKIRNKKL